MEPQWQVGFISEKVYLEFLELPVEIRAKVLRIVSIIENEGLSGIGMPYVRYVRDKIWEIRAKGNKVIGRSLYVAVHKKRIVILRSFIKKTESTPLDEVELALKRWKEHEGDIGDDFYSVR